MLLIIINTKPEYECIILTETPSTPAVIRFFSPTNIINLKRKGTQMTLTDFWIRNILTVSDSLCICQMTCFTVIVH